MCWHRISGNNQVETRIFDQMKLLCKTALLLLLFQFPADLAQAQVSNTLRNGTFVLDTPSMLFLSVEPFEIRIEIMIKGANMVELLKFPLAVNKSIPVDQQDRFKGLALSYFGKRFALQLEGIPAQPDTSRAHFLKIGDTNSVIKEAATDEPVADAVIGLAYVFPLDEMPDYFQLALRELPQSINRMPAQVRVQETIREFEFSQYMTAFDWSSREFEFNLPDIKPVGVVNTDWLGRPMLIPGEGERIIEQLLWNIYNAFTYRLESAIYDQLAISIAGDQLTAIYLEERQRMEAVNRGGARVKILDVDVLQIEDLKKSGTDVVVTAQWEVGGQVTHFGHTHDRRNAYRAKMTLSPIDNNWKVVAIDIMEEKRI